MAVKPTKKLRITSGKVITMLADDSAPDVDTSLESDTAEVAPDSIVMVRSVLPQTNMPADLAWLDGHQLTQESFEPVNPGEVPGQYLSLAIECIQPNPWNPNVQSTREHHALTERIKEVGFIEPIQVVPLADQPGDYMIIGGEHRWRACKSLGYKHIPAIVLTDARFRSVDLQKFVTMQLNVLRGKLDPEKFIKLYQDLAKRYTNEAMQKLMGFTDKAKFSVLVRTVAENMPEELRGEFTKKAAKADTPDDLRNLVEDIMARQGDDMRLSFMILTIDEQPNLWVRADQSTYDAMTQLMDVCRTHALDMNIALQEALGHAITYFKEPRNSAADGVRV